MIDQLYIDFDHTLFDTARLSSQVRAIFLDAGMPDDVFEATLTEAKQGKGGTSFWNYSFEHHIEVCAAAGYEYAYLLPILETLIQEDHSFSDTYTFLSWARAHARTMYLLTAGNPDFQMKKIATTHIPKYIDDIIICHHKKYEEVALRIQDQKTVVFVNDNVQENIDVKNHVKNMLVVTKKYLVRHSEEEIIQSGIPAFDTLTDIQHYIQKVL
jgi:FMN phosphatase YigB (HAD superfamily)